MVQLNRLGAATAAIVLAVSASPVETETPAVVKAPLKLVTTVKTANALVNRGRERLQAINNPGSVMSHEHAKSARVTNDLSSYVAKVDMGGSAYELIVDTGSSITWCGAQNPCEPTKTGQDTGNIAFALYGTGIFSGEEFIDTVSFAGLEVCNQSIAAATAVLGFNGVDGILGLGPVALTEGIVNNTLLVPTFMNNLYAQGSIAEEVLGVYFAPLHGSSKPEANGELTLGGTDSTKYVGPLSYYPTLKTGPASRYWGISVAEFSYGGTHNLGCSNNAIVDTGTTLLLIPTPSYHAFLNATHGYLDPVSQFTAFNTAPTHSFGVKFGKDITYTLTPEQYLVPESQYAAYNLTSGKYYALINDSGAIANGTSVDTIIGQAFLESYYSVFDATKQRIGFAQRA